MSLEGLLIWLLVIIIGIKIIAWFGTKVDQLDICQLCGGRMQDYDYGKAVCTNCGAVRLWKS